MNPSTTKRRSPWLWVPSLYFAEGIPLVVVMTVAVVMYKRLGISNTSIALYTSWLYLPWVIKPFWSPLVDVLRTKRFWIVAMQLLIGAGLAGVALTIPAPHFFRYTLAFLWLLAFSSATHDVAADGFYLLGLSDHDQAWFVGIRNTAYRLAMIAGQGLLIMLAGTLESWSGLPDLTLPVAARPDGPQIPTWQPAKVTFPDHGGPAAILSSQLGLEIGMVPQRPEDVTTLRQQVRNWNVGHDFYQDETAGADNQEEGTARRPAWLIALEDILRKWFGPRTPDAARDEAVGNVGIAFFRLSQPLAEGQSLTVNLRLRGSKSIEVIEGTRLRVSPVNQDQPFAALVQVDPRLNEVAKATLRATSGNFPLAWSLTFYFLAGSMLLLGLYHRLAIPKLANDHPGSVRGLGELLRESQSAFASFFRKRGIVVTIAFLLLYRFSEAQLAKLAQPFLLDGREVGGLALSTGWVGFAYGTVGVVMLMAGGLIGGFLAARDGLKHWLWWMVLAINLPNLAYVALAYGQPENPWIVVAFVGIEQFGYGLGFTAYMLYMIYASQGHGNETVHYALCTGLMALGMMVPGMFSGWLQELIGYQHFFVWVMLATLPGFLMTALIPLDPEFGKRKEDDEPAAP